MVTIVIKPAKNNSRSRRYQSTRAYFAMKDKMADELLERKVARALIGSPRVCKAIMLALPRKPDEVPVVRSRQKTSHKSESGLTAGGRQKMKGK